MSNHSTNGFFIGRFQPIHEGHIAAIKQAASQVHRLVIIVGSANTCRSIKNPWTYQERVDMIRKKLFQEDVKNVMFVPLNDYMYNDHRWITEVRAIIANFDQSAGPSFRNSTLFGVKKEGNDYLDWFPGIRYKSLPAVGNFNSTDIRVRMFESGDPAMPKTVMDDYLYYKSEELRFAGYPFPETLNFNCADAIVTCLGHVLLIERKFAPGRGTWALPGGFRNRNETFLQCAIRELREETNLRVPERVLLGSIKSQKLYDNPKRSFGIPRNTLAVHFDIAPDAGGSLPRANGTDDANEAKWIELDTVINSLPLYDDHKWLISEATGIVEDFAFLKE